MQSQLILPPNQPNTLLMLAVALVGVFAFIQVYSVQAVLPVLMQDLHASEVQAGLAVGATVMGVALMSPFMGMLSDAIGRKVFIVGSLLFLSVPTALMATVPNIETMMLYRLLQGIAVPGITVVLIAYIGEEFDGKMLARLMSLYVAGTVLGGFSGRFILGHLNEMIGWRQAFYVMALLCVVSALFVWHQLPRSRRFEPKPNIQTALYTLGCHLRNRYVLTAGALGGCVLFSLVGCFTYINLYLADAPYYLSSADLANLFAVYLIGMVITPLSARLINRFGAARTVLMAVCLSVAGVLATLLSPLPLIVAGLILMSSGVFITQAATISYIAVNVKEGRSLASGLYYMSYYSGGTFGAYAGGLAYRFGGWHGVVLLLLTVQILALLVAGKGMIKTSKQAA